VPQLTEQELSDILLHELAHIKRRDHTVLLLQKIVGVVLWPQPLLFILNRALSEAREEICDNHVLRFSDRVRYGETLLKLTDHVSPALSLGLLGRNAPNLEDRISHLLNDRRKLVTNSSPLFKCLAIMFCAALTMSLSLATPLGAEEGESRAHTKAHDSSDHNHAKHIRRFKFETKDGNLFIGEPGKGVLFLQQTSSGGFDESDVSPGDKDKVDRLRLKYDDLKYEQDEIASKLRDLAEELETLGVKLRAHAQVQVIGGHGAEVVAVQSSGLTLGTTVANIVAHPVLSSSISKIEPISTSSITIKALPTLRIAKPKTPTTSSDESSIERRLDRLERLIERVLDSNLNDDAPARAGN
jgi:hypothetical protein